MIAALVAAQAAAPLPSAVQLSLPRAVGVPYNDVRGVFTANDMPAYVAAAGVTRFVFSRTTISPEGKAQDCTAERRSIDDQLGAYTCAIILKRAKRFEAGKWLDGSPVYGVLRTPVTYAIGDRPSDAENRKAYPPDMEVSLNRLPAGAKKQVNVSLIIAADENGRGVGCREWLPTSPDKRAKHFPNLVDIACKQISKQFIAIPAKDRSGKQVRSVQSASVLFSVRD